MLTPEQERRWSKMLKSAREYVSIKWGTGTLEDDDPKSLHNLYLSDQKAVVAVGAELTALRLRADGQQHVIDEYGKTVLRMRDENDTLTAQRNFARYDVQAHLETISSLRTQVEAQRAALVAAQTGLAFEGVRVAKVDAIVGTEGLPSWMGGKEESEC